MKGIAPWMGLGIEVVLLEGNDDKGVDVGILMLVGHETRDDD